MKAFSKLTTVQTTSLEDLDKMEGSLHVGTDSGSGVDSTILAFKNKETGEVYLLRADYKEE